MAAWTAGILTVWKIAVFCFSDGQYFNGDFFRRFVEQIRQRSVENRGYISEMAAGGDGMD